MSLCVPLKNHRCNLPNYYVVSIITIIMFSRQPFQFVGLSYQFTYVKGTLCSVWLILGHEVWPRLGIQLGKRKLSKEKNNRTMNFKTNIICNLYAKILSVSKQWKVLIRIMNLHVNDLDIELTLSQN